MSFKAVVFVPVRLIRRSCCRPKSLGMTSAKKDKLNIKDEVRVPVEKDTQKLATYVCGTNLFIDGREDVKIKPDSEYPDWLWTKHAPLPLEQMDKNTKAYWFRVKKIRQKEINYLNSLQRNKSVHK